MKRLATPRTRLVALGLLGTMVALGITVSAIASTGGDEARMSSKVIPHISGVSTAGPCRVGYDTETSTLVPPDDSTSDNSPAGSVQIKKPCSGEVIATLSAEVATPAAPDFLHIDMRATCVAGGGFRGHCTVGQQVFASPGHTFFQGAQAPTHVGSATMAWTGLLRGVWLFEALPGGNNSANLQFRTFTVQTMPGG